jgi:small subunit ribosomal protein S16
MLAIRMQRTGRKGHAMFRVVVQDSRRTPSSGRVVALLGSYDPHTKAVQLEKDKADFYLKNGAQPSERVVRLFQSEGVTLPSWVKSASNDRARTIRNPEKLRRNQPKEEAAATEAEAPVAETSNE